MSHKPEGVLLEFNRERREWEPVTADAPFRDQDRFLSLAPFRSTVTLGKVRVDLVKETESRSSRRPRPRRPAST